MSKNTKIYTLILTFNFLIFNKPAFAYIDPGTGSAIISLIIGLFVTIGVYFKSFWYKIKNYLNQKINKNTSK